MKRLIYLLIVIAFISCKSNENKQAEGAAMDTVKVEESKSEEMSSDTAAAKSTGSQYTCPMHPEINSDKPGQCPHCGMDLEVKS